MGINLEPSHLLVIRGFVVSIHRSLFPAFGFALWMASTSLNAGAIPPNAIVPGSGTQLTQVGDDFEDENWGYVPNNPKSSEDIDEQQRMPIGKSTNGRWFEGVKRGHPDVVKRVPTPEGGLEGSRGAMLMQSLQTGVPGQASRKTHQDDFICNVQYKLGGPIPVSQTPNVTTRVFLPPIEEWEPRSGHISLFVPPWKRRSWKPPTSFFFRLGKRKKRFTGLACSSSWKVGTRMAKETTTRTSESVATAMVATSKDLKSKLPDGGHLACPLLPTGWSTTLPSLGRMS